jgi:hypothetical protein
LDGCNDDGCVDWYGKMDMHGDVIMCEKQKKSLFGWRPGGNQISAEKRNGVYVSG